MIEYGIDFLKVKIIIASHEQKHKQSFQLKTFGLSDFVLFLFLKLIQFPLFCIPLILIPTRIRSNKYINVKGLFVDIERDMAIK